ncbi:hypothetical protein IQ264_05310 [Phormidium sp. LEGE 05292]|uniref:hypothetical protein n=1 Tax=[Phormidium] sp. LEGE 05292 TaxID=767427 RepID=UPI0018827F1F|nr:hypothetical protein [Phormidium sp. LEGE 05292]MBE9224884.1 hypothetical protein [Phormidium sp. LEGE 05292]
MSHDPIQPQQQISLPDEFALAIYEAVNSGDVNRLQVLLDELYHFMYRSFIPFS